MARNKISLVGAGNIAILPAPTREILLRAMGCIPEKRDLFRSWRRRQQAPLNVAVGVAETLWSNKKNWCRIRNRQGLIVNWPPRSRAAGHFTKPRACPVEFKGELVPVIKAANLVRRRGDQEALPVIKRIDKPHVACRCAL